MDDIAAQPRRWKRPLVAVVLMVVPAYVALAKIEVATDAEGKKLAKSLTDASSSAGSLLDDDGSCRPDRARRWLCEVVDSEGSGGATYRVDVRSDGSCWEALLTEDSSVGGMERRVSGCARRHLLPLPGLH